MAGPHSLGRWHSAGTFALGILCLSLSAAAQASDARLIAGYGMAGAGLAGTHAPVVSGAPGAIDAPSAVLDALQSGSKTSTPAAPGSVTGSVVDAEGAIVSGAEVTLIRDGGDARKTQTDSEGRFSFAPVPVGRFRMVATSQGMTPASFSGVITSGETYEVPAMRLVVAGLNADVTVLATQEELAAAELKVEEHQRLAGFYPNFFVTYDFHAASLTTRQKFGLAWKNATDPGNIVVAGLVSGVEQAQNTFPGYGQGAAGYGKRFGAAMGDLVTGTMLGGAVYPTLFHQDPRYFYKGTGTIKSRVIYAITRPVICRGDNGRNQFAISSILGDLSAGAVTNLYYPASDRNGAGLTIAEGFLNIAGDALNDVMQEFVLRHLTPHAPMYQSTTNP